MFLCRYVRVLWKQILQTLPDRINCEIHEKIVTKFDVTQGKRCIMTMS